MRRGVRGGDSLTGVRGALIVRLSDADSPPLYYRINSRKVMPINVIAAQPAIKTCKV